MPPDFYKVQVIHYLNPHLIWVEVCDPTTAEKYQFEQIGLYGILPLDKTLDFTTEELKVQKCDAWIPAATKLLKDILNESVEVWFSPVQIIKRSSIFDDNIHKFGELCIKHKDDKFKKVSKLLIKTSFAYLDIEEFEKKLSSGQLKTKLSSIKTQQVVNDIEKYYTQNASKKKAVKKQTSIFQMSQEFESSLTISNVEKHNNKIINSMLKNKAKDFELCKDIDEESVGCGFKMKPETREGKTSANDFKKSYNEIKELLDAHDIKANKSDSSNVEEGKKDVQSKQIQGLNLLKRIRQKNKKLNETEIKKIELKNNDFKKFDNDEVLCLKTKTIDKAAEPSTKQEILQEWNDIDNVPSVKIAKKSPNSSKAKSKVEKKHVKQVAYGPPDLNIQKFKIKELEVTLDDDANNVDNKVEEIAFDRNKMFEDKGSQLEEAEQNTLDEYFTKINNATNIKEKTINNKRSNSRMKEIHLERNTVKKVKEQCIVKEVNEEFVSKINNASELKGKTAEKNKIEEDHKYDTDSTQTTNSLPSRSKLKKKFEALHELSKNLSSNSSTSTKDESGVSEKNSESSDEDIEDIVKRLNAKYKFNPVIDKKQIKTICNEVQKNNVNPFKNIDANISVFVDKLLTPVLMVHSKKNKRIQPVQQMRDIYFNAHIHNVLKRMSIEHPKMLQTVSWSLILAGYSLFMISPMNSGKTVGYLPAVCRLVTDSTPIKDGNGPIAIIVCATTKSATFVENMAKMFLGLERILTCYPGVNDLHITSALLNGCDLLISTPSILCRLLQLTDFGVDLRRLSILVLDDCERLFDVYLDEVKLLQSKIKEMFKKRTNKEAKVQHILASRVWFDSMESLALKAPDTIICIGAFQECVLYSKTNVSVAFVKKEAKLNSVLNFLEDIDKSKKTVVVCKSDDEVELLKKALKRLPHVVFACNHEMTLQDLYNLNSSWLEFQDAVLGPILLCCDGNLTHMNVTDAHNLIHYSLPNLYSMFCKRFSVLNDFYPSIFKNEIEMREKIKIKILLDESNAEQLPKIVNFIKRCTEVPQVLDEVCRTNLINKDINKAKNLVPLCGSFLMLGSCPEVFNCNERHTILKEFDTPHDWMPKEGFVTFKIVHYHSATLYSGRLLTNIVDGKVTKYPQKFNDLSLKMGLYFCKESNRKLLGIPKVGDICAVSIKRNLYVRCQVVNILSSYERGNPNHVLVKLIDEEWFEVSRDIYLYYLPKDLETIQIPVAQIRLANLAPKDNDVAFSDLATNHIKRLIDDDEEVFLRGHIALTLGNCIFVDTLKVCQSLKSLNETVEKHDIKLELLKDHAIPNEDHLPQLEKLCVESGLHVKNKTIDLKNVLNECNTLVALEKQIDNSNTKLENDNFIDNDESTMINKSEVINQTTKDLGILSGVNKENSELSNKVLESEIYKGNIKDNLCKITPETEEVSIIGVLNNNTEDMNYQNINKFTRKVNIQNNDSPLNNAKVKSETIVLNRTRNGTWASLQEDEMNCVYLGFSKNPEKFFVRLFESEKNIVRLLDDIDVYIANIQTKQVTVKVGELVLAKFPDDSTYERARIEEINGEKVSCFFLDQGDYLELPQDHLLPITDEIIDSLPFQAIECKLLGVQPLDGEWTDSNNKWFCDYCCPGEKQLFAKFYEKKAAEFTGDFKYGVVLFDTNTDKDVNINQLMIDLNLAKEVIDEVQYLHEFDSNTIRNDISLDCAEEAQDLKVSSHLFLPPPIRTVPLVGSDESDDDDRWDVNFNSDTIREILPQAPIFKNNLNIENTNKIQHISKPAICDADVKEAKQNSTTELDSDDLTSPDTTQVNTCKNLNTSEVRRPKLLWRQNKTMVTISILIDVDNYDIVIDDRSIKFSAILNNTKFEFDYELYGMIDKEKSTHSKQGLCVSVKLVKILTKTWLTLTRDSIKQGVSYDVSTIETSSDEEDIVDDSNLKKIISRRAPNDESESDDDNFIGDVNY